MVILCSILSFIKPQLETCFPQIVIAFKTLSLIPGHSVPRCSLASHSSHQHSCVCVCVCACICSSGLLTVVYLQRVCVCVCVCVCACVRVYYLMYLILDFLIFQRLEWELHPSDSSKGLQRSDGDQEPVRAHDTPAQRSLNQPMSNRPFTVLQSVRQESHQLHRRRSFPCASWTGSFVSLSKNMFYNL